jgi:hypothetical protein
MDEFFPSGASTMASDETPKIEPTLVLRDAPSIAADEPKPEATREPGEVAVIAAPKGESTADAAKAEALKAEAPKAPEVTNSETPKIEAPTLPRAPQLGATKALVPFKALASTAEPAAQGRSTRFALLAASVAIAASFGAVAGSLGVAKLGPALSPAPVAVVPAKEHVADEVKALKESVAQLRATTKSLSDNLAALKTTVASTGAQSNKIAETLERLEKGQTEQRKASTTQAASETTGSITQKQAAVPMVLGDPPTTLKPPIVQGWVLRRVYDGAALIEGRDGIIEVEPGIVAPGLGRIEGIKRQDGRWVVVTSRGLVVGR